MTPPRHPRLSLVLAGVILFSLGVSSIAGAQSPPAPGRVAVSATLGLFRPVDSAMTDVYGSHLAPLTGQVDLRILRDISLFGGLTWMSADGQSVVLGTPVVNETSGTSFSVTTIRIGAEVAKTVASRWTLAGGAGVALAGYEEHWPDAGQDFAFHATGFLLLAEARYSVRARLAVIGRVEYSSVPARVSDGSSTVNIGGVDLSAGVRFVF